MGKIKRLAIQLIALPIRAYQYLISPVLPCACRFYPSCSRYTLEAIQVYGLSKGLLKSIFRLCRCHPWSPGGYDPVQPVNEK